MVSFLGRSRENSSFFAGLKVVIYWEMIKISKGLETSERERTKYQVIWLWGPKHFAHTNLKHIFQDTFYQGVVKLLGNLRYNDNLIQKQKPFHKEKRIKHTSSN